MNHHRMLPIKPTRINDAYIHGPLYHYDRISDADARAIGATRLPGPRAGSVVRHDGVTARRLKCGALNVTIESTSGILRDKGVDRFMEILLDPREHGSATTIPAHLSEPSAAPRDNGLDAGARG